MSDDPEIASPRVVCAALLNTKTGEVICGARHFDTVMMQIIEAMGPVAKTNWRTAQQGFIDQFGNFLSREEARVVAEREGQIIRRFSCPEHMLFSEHLY
jgi:hypothetical protein